MSQARGEVRAFAEEAVITDIGGLLDECTQILQAVADQKGIALARSTDSSEGSIMVSIPPLRLRQALMGLLENAIDHNRPSGSVDVSAVVEEATVKILVRDTGPGIAPEHMARIFEPFYRANRSRDASGHLGLGLYLVKSHVEAIGGKCTVQSEVGSGSTFQIMIPLPKKLEKPLATAVMS
jgi:signal transduction histidine kinase